MLGAWSGIGSGRRRIEDVEEHRHSSSIAVVGRSIIIKKRNTATYEQPDVAHCSTRWPKYDV